jgi:hypothetical protein
MTRPVATPNHRPRETGRLAARVVIALFALSVSPPRAASAVEVEETWSVFSIGETPVGYALERRSEEAGSRLTESTLEATLNRLGGKVEMRFASVHRESPAGQLEWLRSDVVLSRQAVRAEVFVEARGIRVVSSAGPGATPHERLLERGSEPLLGPEAVRRMSVERLRQAGDVLEYTTFALDLQRVTTVSRTVEAVAVPSPCAPGGPSALRVREEVDGQPAARTLWLDEAGGTVGDAVEGPFGPMTTCRATREAALAMAQGGSLPAEMYARTVVRANLRLADPAGVDRLVLRLRPRDPARQLPEFTAHNQSVRDDGDALRVEIRRPAAPEQAAASGAAGAGAPAVPTPAAEYLTPNALVESDHAQIVALAQEVAGDERDPWRAAQELTRWVAENVRLDLGVVMAPAAELVRDRRATCVGYATLLAALTRAHGIPSRVAMGAVYYGGIWGGHAWTEVWIDGRWLPLDAAVYAPGVASAVRLAAGTSSLQDGGGELTARLGQLFGNVDVEILELESGGRVTPVAAGSTAYSIAGDAYLNPGLGLRVEASGWQVEEAESVWPSTLVVAFRRGEERVELHELSAAPARRSVEAMTQMVGQGRAVLAVPGGGTLWIYSADGPRPAATLRELLPLVTMAGAG